MLVSGQYCLGVYHIPAWHDSLVHLSQGQVVGRITCPSNRR